MNVKYNYNDLRDKILACWVGKNIGGTVGAPFEGSRVMNDATGFTTPKGEPLPNDDLDLQLVWLFAMEQIGPHALTANILSDYWLSSVSAHCNEYGVAKGNIRMGLLPPITGEYCNEVWKNSNGAWIRSEIWACMTPGFPNVAVKYAIMDAIVDHGISEGTYAEMFTAALESLAFFETDIRTTIEKALTYIPADCRIAQSVRMVMGEYDKGTFWKDVRNMIVEQNKDLGWFQAPGNIGFLVLGLMYGEGDFKKSMLYAVNCGDDADCTAATCGAFLGIMGGMKAIPEDWREYIGDRIVTIAVDCDSLYTRPKTCTELTDRVLRLIPLVLKAHNVDADYVSGESEYKAEEALAVLQDVSKEFLTYSPYSFEWKGNPHTSAVVEYERAPIVRPGEDFKIKLRLQNYKRDARQLNLDVILPEGWTADYYRTAFLIQPNCTTDGKGTWEMTVHVGEKVEVVNKLYLSAWSMAHPMPMIIPITILG